MECIGEYFGSLSQVALLKMMYDITSDEGIYDGSDISLYYKNAKMNNWNDYSKNPPTKRISGMNIYYGENREGVIREGVITISKVRWGFWRLE